MNSSNLSPGIVHHIQTSDQFQKIITKDAVKKGIIVDFYADWCAPCKQISPIFEQLAKEFNRIVFLKVNSDEHEDIAKTYNVQALPTFIALHNGSKQGEVKGANPQSLRSLITELENKTSVFSSSSGYSLSNSGINPSSTSQTGRSLKSFNPWRDPNFKPPSMIQNPPPSSSTFSSSNTSTKSRPYNPYREGKAPPSMPKIQPVPPISNTLIPSSNDSQLKVNPIFMEQLLEMGIDRVPAEKSLILTQNKNLDDALNWIFEHSNDQDYLEPLSIVAKPDPMSVPDPVNIPKEDNNPEIPLTQPKKNIKGAPLGYKPGEIYENEEDDLMKMTNQLRKEKEEKRKKALKLAFEKKGANQELTLEEKIVVATSIKAENEQNQKKINEKKHRENIKASLNLQELQEEKNRTFQIQSAKREKESEKQRLKKIKDQINADKERRKKENEEMRQKNKKN